MSSRNRRFESGHEKRKKKQRLEAAAQTQRGALDRYVLKDSQFTSQNQTPDANVGEGPADDGRNTVEVGVEVNSEGIGHVDEAHARTESNNDNNSSFQPDIYDPRYWDSLDSKMIDILLQKGPIRDLSILKGPKDRFSRRFSATFYTRVLANGETCDREWLVYCKPLDRVFCFCCKLLRKGHAKGQLANDGFSDWNHFATRLKRA